MQGVASNRNASQVRESSCQKNKTEPHVDTPATPFGQDLCLQSCLGL